jgi:hypothetical protein
LFFDSSQEPKRLIGMLAIAYRRLNSMPKRVPEESAIVGLEVRLRRRQECAVRVIDEVQDQARALPAVAQRVEPLQRAIEDSNTPLPRCSSTFSSL